MYICIDLGGSNIRGTWIKSDGTSGSPVTMKRPKTLTDTKESLCSLVTAIQKQCSDEVQKFGLASAGPMDFEKGVYLSPTNMPELKGFDLKGFISESFGKDVILENDAQAAALGEVYRGCLRGKQNALFFTLGTGLGSGVVMDGTLWKGKVPAGPELGHIYLGPGRRIRCGCGQVGCAETWLNSKALLDMARQRLPVTGLRDLDPYLNDFHDNAIKVMEDYGHRLGLFLSQMVSIFGIGNIGLGGGISRMADYFLPAARRTLEHRLNRRDWLLPRVIRSSSDPDMSALWGMCALMIQNHNNTT
ncbi:ROK family protein [Desulfonatronovibrio magnus]|uniref:ROK family protein n=1 Tax=Desulfonatronovibrio magnus TaxID=698827 RepID=UPI0006976C67|nr:ROK family protein [Desulfonatronovibrio magnus]